MTREVKDLWRPVFEQYAALAWTSASVALMFASIPYHLLAAGVCGAFGIIRGRQALDLYRFRLAISGQRLSHVSVEEMLDRTRTALAKQKALWIGTGFGWTQKHTQTAKEILSRNPDEIPTLPTWLPEKVRSWVLPNDTITDPHAIGASWIHGVEPDERDLFLPLSALPGHTLIVGTTRSGKTRLYELLTFQAVHSGETVIVFDPKGDRDWEHRLRMECQRCGRDFLFFHLAFPSKSIRINPLASWNNPSEISSRISQLLGGDAGGDSFVDFADLTINRIVNGLIMIGIRPSLKNTKHYVESGVDSLLEQCFQTFFVPREGPNWDTAIAPYMQKGAGSRVHAMAEYYREKYVREKGEADETLSGLISTLTHDREHFGKMILKLLPLLQRLATGDLGELLSPDVADFDDPRPVYSMEKIVTDRKVLYVGADTLSNKMVGSATMSMLLADMAAVAGAIYNFTESGQEQVYLFMDEAAEGLNDQAIQILNKAGGAGFKVFIATQTAADLEVRLGKKPKALQVLGNTNNVICLRVRDYETAKLVADMMGETTIRKVSTSHNLGSETEATVVEFRGSITRSQGEEKAPLISPDVLTRLPNLQYVAMVAGGTVVKGRLPIIGK
ncbi:MAG: conjugative transfer system coupling protein TraD [Georgfuchsia sp.]